MRKITILFVSIVLTASLVLGSGCAIVDRITSSTSNQTDVVETLIPPEEGTSGTDVTIPVCELQPALPCIADVVAEVKPAVVVINTEVAGYDFFNRPVTQEATGSGFIITKDGYIVTNNHVIEGSQSITIILDDGRNFSAELVGADPLTDIAVIKIDAVDLPTARIGDSSLARVGDWVVAIGNSLGEGISATNGIVSVKNATLSFSETETLYNLIRTNAEINQGNSGGPLVNMSGDVIGITNAKVASIGVEGMNYAISMETAKPIIEQLINQGYASHPWLGVSLYTVDEYVIDRFFLTVDKGAFLVSIEPDSPASESGLQQYDVIVGFDDKQIDTVDDLVQEINKSRVGQEVEITYWHGNRQLTTTVVLGERPLDN
jgi:serine protease Do